MSPSKLQERIRIITRWRQQWRQHSASDLDIWVRICCHWPILSQKDKQLIFIGVTGHRYDDTHTTKDRSVIISKHPGKVTP